MSIIGRDANKNKKCFAACQPGTYCECLGKTIEEKDCGFSDISCILQHMSSVAKSEELVGNLQIAGDIECWVDQIRQLNTTTRPPVAGLADINSGSNFSNNSINNINSPPEISDNSIDTYVAPSTRIELDGNRVYLDSVLIGSIVEEPDGLKFKTDCYDVLCSGELRALADELDALNIGLSGATK